MSLFSWFAPAPDIQQGELDFQKADDAVLLDVRTAEEYAQGHLTHSVNLPLDQLSSISYGKDVPLYVYCHSGARSARACDWLRRHGYEAINIGGIMHYRGAREKGGAT
ncbi:rhodanese-like domain-containing protein [Oscillibacter sp.]|uniref:rhodanese-like domain-containing protein n=1 Tax=Oscillibacter sp. TaxID=1945593 RepID=UPI00262D5533|nr:rhodanese-like domain-containing protein [Oscillibacter sp.]MDD3347644.1 rhodanese-like domain-containing protein [Oscillibacter sp.]